MLEREIAKWVYEPIRRVWGLRFAVIGPTEDGIRARRGIVRSTPPRTRPRGFPCSFVCPACDVMLWDEVDYTRCPVCDLPVDWVNPHLPLWCCATCDRFVNLATSAWPHCERCTTPMDAIRNPGPPLSRSAWSKDSGALVVFVGVLATFAAEIVLVCDPLTRILVAPKLLMITLLACAILALTPFMIAGFIEFARDPDTRIRHGFEHGAVAVLAERGLTVRSGQTVRGHFVLELVNDPRATPEAILDATRTAIRRIHAGEHVLAYSPRCGTSVAIGLWVVSVAIVGTSVTGLVLGASVASIVVGTAATSIMAALASRPLGLLAQRLLTVSVERVDATIAISEYETDGEHAYVGVSVQVRRAVA